MSPVLEPSSCRSPAVGAAPYPPLVPFGFVDLFSGIGGFHAALTALGGRGLLASEIDKSAQKVYVRNWGLEPAGDVRLLAADPQPGSTDEVRVGAGRNSRMSF